MLKTWAGAVTGFSLSGRPVPDSGVFAAEWGPLLGSTATTNRFKISVNGTPSVDVDLSTVVVGTDGAAAAAIVNTIQTAFSNAGIPCITVAVTFPASAGSGA